MDKRDIETLRKIAKKMPSFLKREALKKTKPFGELAEKADYFAKKGDYKTAEKLRKISSMESQEIDKKIEKKIERYWEENIKRERKAGRLGQPQRDDFIKRIEQKTGKRVI